MRLYGREAAPVSGLAWSADGRLLASASAGPALSEGPFISLWKTDDWQLAHVIDESAAHEDNRQWIPSLTPDGEVTFTTHPARSSLAFSPDGRLFASHFGMLVRFDPAFTSRCKIGPGARPLQATRDGRFLLCGAGPLWDLTSGCLLPGPLDGQWDSDSATVNSAGLAADGSWYAWCTSTEEDKYDPCEIRIGLADPMSGVALEIVSTEHRSYIPSKLILDAANDRIFTREIYHTLFPAAGRQRLALWQRAAYWKKTDLDLTARDFAVTADGRKLVAIEGDSVIVKSLDRNGKASTTSLNSGTLTALSISPDSSAVAVGTESGLIEIVQLGGEQ